MARSHPCDLCGYERRRWQRLCGSCWAQLPSPMRTAIVESWRRGSKAQWRQAKRAALNFVGDRVSRHMARISAEEAYQRNADRMGERDA